MATEAICCQPRRFRLVRDHDVSGVSGVGAVAEGVEFTDGSCVVRWTAGEHRSTVVWASVEDALAIHGHGGATRVEWLDACACSDAIAAEVGR